MSLRLSGVLRLLGSQVKTSNGMAAASLQVREGLRGSGGPSCAGTLGRTLWRVTVGRAQRFVARQSAVFHVPALASTWVGASPCPLQLVWALPRLGSHSPRAGSQARPILGQPWKPEGVRQAGGLCQGRARGVGAGRHGHPPGPRTSQCGFLQFLDLS